jgi:hypothetical protein
VAALDSASAPTSSASPARCKNPNPTQNQKFDVVETSSVLDIADIGQSIITTDFEPDFKANLYNGDLKKNSDRDQFFDKFKFTKSFKKTNKIFYEFTNSKINNFKKMTSFYNFDLIMAFYFKPLFFKYFYYFFTKTNSKSIKTFSLLENITYFKDFFFYSENNAIFSNNILPNAKFNYILKKKMLKVFNYSKFPTVTTL